MSQFVSQADSIEPLKLSVSIRKVILNESSKTALRKLLEQALSLGGTAADRF